MTSHFRPIKGYGLLYANLTIYLFYDYIDGHIFVIQKNIDAHKLG